MQSKDLTLAAANLARSSPNLWASFLLALAEQNDILREKLVMSPVENMQVIQGRAQYSTTLLHDLTNCVSDADKITQKV